jgi:hypothetical protein
MRNSCFLQCGQTEQWMGTKPLHNGHLFFPRWPIIGDAAVAGCDFGAFYALVLFTANWDYFFGALIADWAFFDIAFVIGAGDFFPF